MATIKEVRRRGTETITYTLHRPANVPIQRRVKPKRRMQGTYQKQMQP